jgi:signal-transduction protein with cAMP-binding, CBS, and nucleotidyltransferase domain
MAASQTAVFTRFVRDHMRAAPPSVRIGTDCDSALARMTDARASCVIVADAANRIAGIVTEQDATRRIAFRLPAETPVEQAMSAPVATITDGDYLYHAVAVMRRRGLRHMPVIDAAGVPVGMLELHDALAVTSGQMVDQIDRLTHEQTVEGMAAVKGEQVSVAEQLFADNVPAPEILSLISRINGDLHRGVIDLSLREMADQGLGAPPVPFAVIVMGSGGRGESAIGADQDNGFILADYDDADHRAIDRFFIDLALRMTETLDRVGLPLCAGGVMASNPLWRKSLGQWRTQLDYWLAKRNQSIIRLADIFFDFRSVYGEPALAAALRDHVTERMASAHPFLQVMHAIQSEHRTALGWFGRLRTHDDARHKDRLNLKYDAGLPLVETVRLLSMVNGVAQTGTRARLGALSAAGIIGKDERDYLHAAFDLITGLMLRQQIADFRGDREVGYWLDPDDLSARDRDLLVDGLRAIEALRDRVNTEFTGSIF